jgi:NAD-dependent deacetylase
MGLADEIGKAAEILASSHHAVALTGAGISTPSGIPDFRSSGVGLWNRIDPMAIASVRVFQSNPQAFYEWIRPLAKRMMEAQPNAAHIAIATMEKAGVIKTVITHNIDELHHKAGSRHVLELHGSARTATCTGCGRIVPSAQRWKDFVDTGEAPRCSACHALLKPDVVLFGELLPVNTLRHAEGEAKRCDAMLVAGSSLEVYPAAALPGSARRHGARLILVNLQPTGMDPDATVVIHEDVAVVLPQIAAEVKELRGIV